MPYRKFLSLYIGFFLLLFVMTTTLLFYLSLLFEHNSYEEIAKRQIKNHSIYGSALNENYFSYRLKMIELQKPDILAVGSSRVGQFKAKYFNLSFYTAANGANNIEEMRQFINRVLEIYTPKVMILGLDPWWFNKKIPSPPQALSYQTLQGDRISADKIKGAIKLLSQNKLPLSFDFLNAPLIHSPHSSKDSLGIRAITDSNGTFVDGSYFYASILYQTRKFIDIKFANTLWKIKNNKRQFTHGQEISEARIKTFNEILLTLQKKNIKVIAIFTPIAHQIFQVMSGDFREKYTYLFQLLERTKELKIENFFDPSVLPHSSDCEFYDGFHGGDVIYARILAELAKNQPSFAKYFNLESIHNTLKNKSGFAYSGEHFGDLRELDFLQIGCKK